MSFSRDKKAQMTSSPSPTPPTDVSPTQGELAARQADHELAHEQSFVDRAYQRLDALRDDYRATQKQVHATHGVGNAQGWTERDAIAAHLGDIAARLEQVEDRLVFGRIDTQNAQTHYIGRTALSEESGHSLLVDWRAPAARPFYQATGKDPLGVVRRRHIHTQARKVIGLEDDLLQASSDVAHGMELQGEGALMSALSQARDGRMGDIVSTIQAEQDAVIRASGDGLLVLQGGPGTGKTAVALHRAAYLLYAERERLERSGVLIVGPSRVFLRYIEQVLPSLGESGVVSVTMGDLVPGIKARGVDSEEVAEIKGREAWARIAKQAVRAIQRLPKTDQLLEVWSRSVTLTPADVRTARHRARSTNKQHNIAREGFALELIDVLAKRLIIEAGDARSEEEISSDDLRMWRAEVRSSLDARRAINLAWMPTSSVTLLERLYARPDFLAHVNQLAGSPLSKKDMSALYRAKGSPLTVSDVPILDELEEFLGTFAPFEAGDSARRAAEEADEIARAQEAISAQGLGGGIVTAEMLAERARGYEEVSPMAERAASDRTWTYGHIVVDEAQDLSPMAWRALLRRNPSLSFTVVGDLDQRRGHSRPQTWPEALGPAARAYAGEHILTVSYRTPGALTRLAARVMAEAGAPLLHPLTAVREVEDAYSLVHVPTGDSKPREVASDPLWEAVEAEVERACARLDESVGEGRGRVAVVVGQERARVWKADIEGYSGLEHRVSLLGAVGVKGLEFDHVIVVAPSEILEDGPGDLFVALTRATQSMSVVYSTALPAGMDEVP